MKYIVIENIENKYEIEAADAVAARKSYEGQPLKAHAVRVFVREKPVISIRSPALSQALKQRTPPPHA